MSQNASGANDPAASPTLEEIDVVVEEIASLSRAPVAPSEFYPEFLRRVVAGLAALGGAVWIRHASGRLHAGYELAASPVGPDVESASLARHEPWAAHVLEQNAPCVVSPGGLLPGSPASTNPTGWLLLFCPWAVGGGRRPEW